MSLTRYGLGGSARAYGPFTAKTEHVVVVVYIAGTFGICRRLPGHHPIGTELFGLPRRVYLDEKNVRLEHWREPRALEAAVTESEWPDRLNHALELYVLATCYGTPGPAQDLTLAKHYAERYARAVARIHRRVASLRRTRVTVMGGNGNRGASRNGPPRPRLPWNYGQEIR